MSKMDNMKRPKVGREQHARLEELVDLLKLPEKEWVTLRIIPGDDVLSFKQHWIDILAGKDKREVRIPKICVAYDPETEEDKKGCKCPYCELASAQKDKPQYLLNVMVRSLVEDMPAKVRTLPEERESGYKSAGSKSWTPIRVWRVPAGLMLKIMELKDLNKVKGKTGTKTFHVWHEKYGIDINVKYDSKKPATDKYQINLGSKAPLTEEENEFLRYQLSEELLDLMGRETPKAALEEIKRMQIVGEDQFDDEEHDEDEDEDDVPLGKSKSKGKPAPSKKRRPSDDDEDDEDDEDEDEDDEDDKPSRGRGKSKPAPSKKRRPSDDDDDDDDDEDDEDEDEDEDEPAPRRGKAPARGKPAPSKKRRSADDDDDDDDEDDEDDEDEDDEDEPAPRRGKSKPAPKGKSRRPVDDDDDEDDEGDEDDEDDEPAPRRGKSKPAPKGKASASKKRRSSDDDDEDDDDIPF